MSGVAPSRALLLHLSVPSWTTVAQLDRAWNEVIGPSLDAVIDSGNPVGVVLSGRLVEIAPSDQQERVEALRTAAELGRVELVGTALHEPVLGSIPIRDAVGQYRSHTTMLRRLLGERPTGGWVPHGLWDSAIPEVFDGAGLGWTTVERSVLEKQGCPGAPALSVEHHGKAVVVLPSVRLTPRAWSGLAVLQVRTPRDVQVLAAALPRASVLPHVLTQRPRARAYLQAETGWQRVLLAEAGADRLHKRMLSVSRLVRRVAETIDRTKHVDGGPDPRQLEQARRYLYRAQAAEALLPVKAGEPISGTYRDRAWRDLIRSERVALAQLPLALPSVRDVDEDCDGIPEVRVLTRAWSVTVAPGREGAITELAHRKSATNLLSGAHPVAFRERWNEGAPVAMEWELVTTEAQESRVVAKTLAESFLEGSQVQVLKSVVVGATGPAQLRLEVRPSQGAARGMLTTELFLNLGGPHLDGDDDCALSVEVAGGKEPIDEVIELPGLDAVGVCGWRSRVDLTIDPKSRIVLEPLDEGAVRLAITWPMEVLSGDVWKAKLKISVREVTHG